MAILWLTAGLLLLTAGAEVLIRSAVKLAAAARISPLVIGLTVVAFGTSAPELVVGVQATVRGQSDIALGNVVGSNIFNVLFILGVSALITPLVVARQLIRLDVPLMIGLSLLLLPLGFDGSIGRWDGALLVGLLVLYTTWAIVQSRRERSVPQDEFAAEYGGAASASTASLGLQFVLLLAGLGLLVIGSRWFTDAAIAIALALGLSELVIGLTIVAAGTSLPEVATSVLAALRGERDIAVGNVVGSNLFNIMGVLGISGVAAPEGIPVSATVLQLDLPVMIAVAVACLPVFFTGHRIARWEGALFFCYYLAYTVYLILDATGAEIRRTFATIMLAFVLPLTVLTLGIGVARALRNGPEEEKKG